jgi:group I intron endonuclease
MRIYLATNKINGMQYIGQTVRTLEQRWNSHVSAAMRGKGNYLAKAIKKYGAEQFTVETISMCESKEEMDFTEVFYIALLRTQRPSGYNLTAGGEGNLGWNPSEEIRSHMGAPKGTVWTTEAKAKRSVISQARWDANPQLRVELAERMKGNSHTKGRTMPEEEKFRRSIASKGNTNAKKLFTTHCDHGHEWTTENIYIHPNGITRSCKVCKHQASSKSNVKNKGKRNATRRVKRHSKFI